MGSVDFYCWVEDQLSAEVGRVLVQHVAQQSNRQLGFKDGFPCVVNGFGNIKKSVGSYLQIAQSQIPVFVITDLDRAKCAPSLIRDWFKIEQSDALSFPDNLVFRVAVREVESWLLADFEALAKFLGIAKRNFVANPEELLDPKQTLLSIINKKGKKAWHRKMLPQSPSASIGPSYNNELCRFVTEHWNPARAQRHSSSLDRTIKALSRV